jgi:hypothetical protein
VVRVGPDYRIRPAKAVLRRIVLEAIERLKFIGEVSEYDYFGFGSFSFVDFSLYHRRLRLPRLVSMENQSTAL